LAATVKADGREGRKLRVISCRDAFPKKRVNDSKMLVQKGMALRRNGQIAYFRVIAQGDGCIPVLEVKHWLGSGGQVSARWEVFTGEERPPLAVPMPAGNGGRGRGGRGGAAARGGGAAGGGGTASGRGAARGGGARGGNGGGARGGTGRGANRGGNGAGGGGRGGAAGSRVGGGAAGNGGQWQGNNAAAGRGGRMAATGGRPPMTPRRIFPEGRPEYGFPGMLETIEHGHMDEDEGYFYEPY
jgi:hypothetical protein